MTCQTLPRNSPRKNNASSINIEALVSHPPPHRSTLSIVGILVHLSFISYPFTHQFIQRCLWTMNSKLGTVQGIEASEMT